MNARINMRERIVGLDRPVPLLDGRLVPYINFDNASSTPPLVDVVQAVQRFLPFYSSVHRGTGFKSRLSTAAYEQAHAAITRFVSANPDSQAVIFGKNATEAINKLSYRLRLPPGSVVLTTYLEHHSNDLPWRSKAQVIHVRATPEGRLDEADFQQLAHYAGRVGLVAVSGASNVTGFIQPIHRLARKAHAAGAKILVDAAQLAPHRRVDMKPDDDPEHLDFVVLSAHKMYAPFGTGALVGPKQVFLQDGPEYSGGGTVEVVTLDSVHWAGLPERDEAGSPNVVGAVAMAAAAQVLMEVGYVVHLLKLPEHAAATWRQQLLGGDRSNMPGMVRISFGCYNTIEEIDHLVDMLERIRRDDYAGDYHVEPSSGEYVPAHYVDPLADYFSLS